MRNFCEFLREHAMKITNFKKKKIKLLTKEQQEPNENRKIYYPCTKKKKEKMKIDMRKIKNLAKLQIVVIIQGNIVVLHIAFVT